MSSLNLRRIQLGDDRVLMVPSPEDGTVELRQGTSDVPGELILKFSSDGLVFKDGTQQVTAGVANNAPAFRAKRSTDLAATPNTWERVSLNTIDFDTTGGDFSSSRFTPKVAGIYSITAHIFVAGSNIATGYASVYKNGVAFETLASPPISTGNASAHAAVSTLVLMNGTTDYVELWGYVQGTSATGTWKADLTTLQGFLVREL